MVAVLQGDDGLPARVRARDFDRILHGLSPGVEQDGALVMISGSERIEHLADLDVTHVWGHHEACMGELGHGLPHCGHDLGVRIADVSHAQARDQVNKGVAIGIHEHSTAPPDDEDRDGVTHARRDCRLPALHVLARLWAGDLGDYPPRLGKRGGQVVVGLDHRCSSSRAA